MKFISTRDPSIRVDLSSALLAGLAADGGLYMPQQLPRFSPGDFDHQESIAEIATQLLQPFFADDPLADELAAICNEAFDFPAPLKALALDQTCVLELFHGPTAAFKDFGARFLAACMKRLRKSDQPVLTILVATSGDTGAAVAAAFHGLANLRVVVLYPDGRVSPRQAHQLGCFGDNVTALRVAGSFDDCQRLVKQALSDPELQAQVPLSSANSISLGRLLPQMSYYAHAALAHWRQTGTSLNFVIPTGNLGNAMAAILARACGLPIADIALATNANRVLPEFFAGNSYAPQQSVATLANAMDVGAPSNFERLRHLYADADELRATFKVLAVDDPAIRATIKAATQRYGEVFCPHTACAARVLEQLREQGCQGHWAMVATAHPAKFEQIVEPLVGHALVPPDALAELLARPASAEPVRPSYEALRQTLTSRKLP
ncbi:MAG TPA: threonine synthase [Dokdonella sp.]|uniref:threonine synthase n=1 Tax=Dokdonella sp. TaxID=2291710 RepID=UPI002D7F3AE0|nr:threonine synthase [Dokdonella sp.]HET9033051.1 threonine synthase [Dokdonella sp.]